jgi:hypothetical protein
MRANLATVTVRNLSNGATALTIEDEDQSIVFGPVTLAGEASALRVRRAIGALAKGAPPKALSAFTESEFNRGKVLRFAKPIPFRYESGRVVF